MNDRLSGYEKYWSPHKMSKYFHVEKSFLNQLATLGYTVIEKRRKEHQNIRVRSS